MTDKNVLPALLIGKMIEYKFHFENERETHYRLSNHVISNLMQMNPTSWRMFEMITSELDVYPTELIERDGFLDELASGKASIPEHFRTVRVSAHEYITRWNLAPNNGYRTFTLDALTLFEESLANISFDPKKQEADVRLSRPISDVIFHTKLQSNELNSSDLVRDVHERLIKRNPDDKRNDAVWQCHAATFVLHERLAEQMLFLREFFTRLERGITSSLSKAGLKLYTMLCMVANSRAQVNGGWHIQWDLEQCNALLDTRYGSIADFSRHFKIPSEVSLLTEFDVTHSPDLRSRVGRKYTHLNIFFTKKSKMEVVKLKNVEVTRKLVPRPRVLPGSAAEGEWARKNIAILIKYERELKEIGRILPKADRERLARYKKIIGEV